MVVAKMRVEGTEYCIFSGDTAWNITLLTRKESLQHLVIRILEYSQFWSSELILMEVVTLFYVIYKAVWIYRTAGSLWVVSEPRYRDEDILAKIQSYRFRMSRMILLHLFVLRSSSSTRRESCKVYGVHMAHGIQVDSTLFYRGGGRLDVI